MRVLAWNNGKILHSSSSDVQQLAEPSMLQALNQKLGLDLRPVQSSLNDGIKVQLDGLDEEHKAVCEIYARIGELKGSQPEKIASDILKMHFYKILVKGSDLFSVGEQHRNRLIFSRCSGREIN